MCTVDEAVEGLLDAILNSDVYKEYVRNLEKVKQYPDLKKQIDEYRLRNFELQQSPDYAFDKIETQKRNKAFNEMFKILFKIISFNIFAS